MKRGFLKFYDKITIAAILGVLAFIGCARKNYQVKKQEQAEPKERQQDSLRTIDSTLPVPPGKFDKNPIAMYGVRPTREIR